MDDPRAPGDGRARASNRRRLLIAGGLASVGSATLGLLWAAARSLVPDVFYETPTRFPVGKPEDFPPGATTYLPEQRIFILNTARGFRAVSAVCTHLGCSVNLDGERGFACPCHGSTFDIEGRVRGGPAAWPLPSFALSLSRRGELVVDTRRRVAPHVHLGLP
jgi:cytochrome b6-f complex iron-sulfur subunit